ncbi:MAG TPA: isopentenyl-diphosphate delta-isomerase [Saprospiraceae bacterium]|nr:isopentenyl-diphosphate delta-isomerase [Saprospiraceae bacterium]
MTKDRKLDHITMAQNASTPWESLDSRFDYHPFSSVHPKGDENFPIFFGKQQLAYPIWISSMTGGTEISRQINQNLAKVCSKFHLGMGLGSCRKIIQNPDCFEDFNVRKYIGHQPLYANLGIAQVEYWLENHQGQFIGDIVQKLEADGLIIHVNPLQELMQTEGDRIHVTPLITIQRVMDLFSFPIIVKEVGQGFSYQDLSKLLDLPLQAIEFASFGGTNFSKLESLRNESVEHFAPLQYVGHHADEMLDFCNRLVQEKKIKNPQLRLIISGGVKNFLDGFYYTEKSAIPALYGQASAFLQAAQHSYEATEQMVSNQIKGFQTAKHFLTLKLNHFV